MQTAVISRDTMILKISNIDTSNIAISYPENLDGSSKTIENRGNVKFIIGGKTISTMDIARAIESKTGIPVLVDSLTIGRFDVDITIDEYNQDLNVWIQHFQNNGITLNIESDKVEYIEIRKGRP